MAADQDRKRGFSVKKSAVSMQSKWLLITTLRLRDSRLSGAQGDTTVRLSGVEALNTYKTGTVVANVIVVSDCAVCSAPVLLAY